MNKIPAVGDSVLYVLSEWDGEGRKKGDIRPAIITNIFGEPHSDSYVQLQVFTDGQNDNLQNVEWRTSVMQDSNKTTGTFHYKS